MACANCGQDTGPRYCGYCGQAVHDRRAPLLGLLRELAEEALALDSRTVRTLRELPRPGRLTRLYLDGKRVLFLTPLRLYLLSSVALFSSLLALAPPKATDINLYVAGELVSRPSRDRSLPNITIMEPNQPGVRWLLTRYADRFAEIRKRPAQEIVDRQFVALRTLLPIALFLFMPILAIALKILYVRSRTLYVDHLVFSLHFQSAVFLALAASWLVSRSVGLQFFWSLIVYVAVWLLMLLVYLPIALRHAYRQGRIITGVKTFVLFFAYLMLLQPVLGATMILAIFQI